MCLISDATNGSNENFQKYKFEGPRSHQKEIAPMWDRICPLAEKYYGISPHTRIVGGDPVIFQLSYKNEPFAPLHIVYHNGIAYLYNGNHSSISGCIEM